MGLATSKRSHALIDPALSHRLRAGLPLEVGSVWDELETAWGRPIVVDLIAEKDRRPDGARAGLRTEAEPVMIVLDVDQTRPASVLHELLHFRRYYIDRVPRMVGAARGPMTPAKQEAFRRIGLLENELEHLVVIPQQDAMGHADLSFWEDGLKKYVWTRVHNRNEIHWRYPIALLKARTLGLTAVELEALGWIVMYGFEAEAEAFCTEALGLLNDKVGLVQLVLGRAPVERSLVRLQRYDPNVGDFVLTDDVF